MKHALIALAAAAMLVGGTQVAAAAEGKAIYDKSCASCHKSGVAKAPKLGDKAAWAALNARGADDLTASVIKGKGIMQPKAGTKLSDADLKDAVEYMMAQGK